MRNLSALINASTKDITGQLALLSAWAATVVTALAGPPSAASSAERATAGQRAHTPLSAIAGVEAPPPVTIRPLDELPELQAAYARARALVEDGNLQAALETLTKVQGEPGADRYEIHYLRAVALARLGQLEEARASAETAARLGHGAADVHYLLGQLHRRAGNVESAIAHYRTATLAAERELNNPNVTLARYFLGRTLAMEGYDLAAAQAFERFDVAIWQTHPEQRNVSEVASLLTGRAHGMVPERLRLLQGLGRADDALRTAEWVREIWPEDLYADRVYAETLLAAGRAEEAFELCEQRFEDSAAAEGLLPVAVEAAQAAQRLEAWIGKLKSEIAEGRQLRLAAALTAQLNRSEARAHAIGVGKALLAQQPDNGDVAWEVAAAQHATGDLRGALETLIVYVRSRPELSEVPQRRLVTWMSWCEEGMKIVGMAQELRGQPDADFATEFVLGVSAMAAGQTELAGELLQSCIEARPDFAPAYVVRAQMLLAAYQWQAAKTHADAVLKRRPDLAAAHFALAEAHDGLDENEQAEQAYKRAIKAQPAEAAYKLALARHYRRLGNLLGAQRYFQETLASDPDNAEALEGLIDCYLRSGKVEIARTQLERIDEAALAEDARRRINTTMRFVSAPFAEAHLAELKSQFDQHPEDVTTARLLAGGLYLWGRLDETDEVLQKIRPLAPDDYHLMILAANVHTQRAEFDDAIALLETLAKRYPNRVNVLQPLAQGYLNDFRLAEGRERLRRLMELDEERRSQYRTELLRTHISFRECDQALELVNQWMNEDPDDEALVHDKIAVLLGCAREAEAFEIVARRLDEAPDDRQRRAEFISYGVEAGQHKAVAARVGQWHEDDPSNAALTRTLIDVLLLDERADKALEVAREFTGTYEESLQRRIWMGRCQAAKGETDKALAECDLLLAERTVPEKIRERAREQIIRALVAAQRYDEALERCAQWLKQAEGSGSLAQRLEALHWKRSVSQVAGRDREAAQVMEMLLEYLPALNQLFGDPGYSVGLFNDLGYVWVDQGMNIEQATKMIQRAVAKEPWNAAFIDSLGWAYYKAGDFANAQKYLSRAVRLRDGQDPVLYDHLGDAAYRLGKREAARQHWAKALVLLEEEPEDERLQQVELSTALRAKQAALDAAEQPIVAPSAPEQGKD